MQYTTPEIEPVNYTVKQLEDLIISYKGKIPAGMSAYLLEKLQRNVASGMRYYDALHHCAMLMTEARIDMVLAEVHHG